MSDRPHVVGLEQHHRHHLDDRRIRRVALRAAGRLRLAESRCRRQAAPPVHPPPRPRCRSICDTRCRSPPAWRRRTPGRAGSRWCSVSNVSKFSGSPTAIISPVSDSASGTTLKRLATSRGTMLDHFLADRDLREVHEIHRRMRRRARASRPPASRSRGGSAHRSPSPRRCASARARSSWRLGDEARFEEDFEDVVVVGSHAWGGFWAKRNARCEGRGPRISDAGFVYERPRPDVKGDPANFLGRALRMTASGFAGDRPLKTSLATAQPDCETMRP